MMHQDEEYGIPQEQACNPSNNSNDGNLLPSAEEYKVDHRRHKSHPVVLGGCFWKMGVILVVGMLLSIILPVVLLNKNKSGSSSATSQDDVMTTEPTNSFFPPFGGVAPTTTTTPCTLDDGSPCTTATVDLSNAKAITSPADEPLELWSLYHTSAAPLRLDVILPTFLQANNDNVQILMAHKFRQRGMTCTAGQWLMPIDNLEYNADKTVVSIPADTSGAVVVCANNRLVAMAYHVFAAIPNVKSASIVPMDLTQYQEPTEKLDLTSSSSAVVVIATEESASTTTLYKVHDATFNMSRGDSCDTLDNDENVAAMAVLDVFGLNLWSLNSYDLQAMQQQGVEETTIFACSNGLVQSIGTLTYHVNDDNTSQPGNDGSNSTVATSVPPPPATTSSVDYDYDNNTTATTAATDSAMTSPSSPLVEPSNNTTNVTEYPPLP